MQQVNNLTADIAERLEESGVTSDVDEDVIRDYAEDALDASADSIDVDELEQDTSDYSNVLNEALGRVLAHDVLEDVGEEADHLDAADVASEGMNLLKLSVALQEVRRTLLSNVASELEYDSTSAMFNEGSAEASGGSGGGDTTLRDLKERALERGVDDDGCWGNVRVRVTTLFDNDNENVRQVGYLEDSTESMRFYSFDESVPMLEEGEEYEMDSVVTNSYETDEGEHRVNLTLNSQTEVRKIDEDEDGVGNFSFKGMLVSVYTNSGYVFEDEEGNYVDNRSEAETKKLQLMGVLDNGHQTQKFKVDEDGVVELTESMDGEAIDLERAEEMARDAMDYTVVRDELQDRLVGRYFRIEGSPGDFTFDAEIEPVTDVEFDKEEMLQKARSTQVV